MKAKGMLNKAEDLKGNWFSNVHGRPEVYHFILKATKITGLNYSTKHVVLAPKKKPLVKVDYWNEGNIHKDFGEPIRDSMTLEKIRKRLIRGLLR